MDEPEMAVSTALSPAGVVAAGRTDTSGSCQSFTPQCRLASANSGFVISRDTCNGNANKSERQDLKRANLAT